MKEEKEPLWPGLPKCPRKMSFLKSHKTASSTVQNVLLRLAVSKNLTVLLPPGGETNDQHQFMEKVRNIQSWHVGGKKKKMKGYVQVKDGERGEKEIERMKREKR